MKPIRNVDSTSFQTHFIGLYCLYTSLSILNSLLTSKKILLLGTTYAVQDIIYPLILLVIYQAVKTYDIAHARKMTIEGYYVSITIMAVLAVATYLPTATTSPVSAHAFQETLLLAPTTTILMISYRLISQLAYLRILTKTLIHNGQQDLWQVNTAANIVVHAIDTFAITVIVSTPGPLLPFEDILNQYLLKIIVMLTGSILLYISTKFYHRLPLA